MRRIATPEKDMNMTQHKTFATNHHGNARPLWGGLGRGVLLALMLFALVTTATAQDAARCFVAMPDTLIPLLPRPAREALIGDGAEGDTVTNALGGVAQCDTLAARYLCVRPTAASRIEVMLLPDAATGGTCVAVIETVTAATDDSRLVFYTLDWQPLPARERFAAPTLSDFLVDGADLDKTARWIEPFLIGLRGSADGSLAATIRPECYLPIECYDKVKNALREAPVAYRWDGRRFVRQ